MFHHTSTPGTIDGQAEESAIQDSDQTHAGAAATDHGEGEACDTGFILPGATTVGGVGRSH